MRTTIFMIGALLCFGSVAVEIDPSVHMVIVDLGYVKGYAMYNGNGGLCGAGLLTGSYRSLGAVLWRS